MLFKNLYVKLINIETTDFNKLLIEKVIKKNDFQKHCFISTFVNIIIFFLGEKFNEFINNFLKKVHSLS